MATRKRAAYTNGRDSVRIYEDLEHNEFQVRLYKAGVHYAPADAFESDLEAAKGTAKAMLGECAPNATIIEVTKDAPRPPVRPFHAEVWNSSAGKKFTPKK